MMVSSTANTIMMLHIFVLMDKAYLPDGWYGGRLVVFRKIYSS